MNSWRRYSLVLLLLAVGAAWAEAPDAEDASCQLEIQRHPNKRPASAKAKAAKKKAKRKHFEFLKIQSNGLAGAHTRGRHKKARRAREEPMLDQELEPKGTDVKDPDVQSAHAAKQHAAALHKAPAEESAPRKLQSQRAPGMNQDEEETELVRSQEHDAKKSHGPTFAVTTRVYSAELPYLKHFLQYYLHKLKVHRVYLFCTEDSEEERIRNAVRGFGFTEKQVKFVRGKRNQSLQRLNYHAVYEDYILDVDCDEFLLPPKGGLKGVVKSDPHADGFHLRWTCYPSDAMENNVKPQGIPCTGLKGMIRTKSLHDKNGHYTFEEGTPMCGGKGPCVFSKHILPLAHIQYRGFWDSVLKDVSSPAGSQWMLKGQPKSIAMKKIRNGQPAKRMQSLAFEMVCVERFGAQLLYDHKLHVPRQMNFAIDGKLQTKALYKAGFDRVLKMQAGKSYLRYKEALHLSFDRLLCNPKKTCNDVKPHHVATLLEKMTSTKLRAYHGRCQKPESYGHDTKFNLTPHGKQEHQGNMTKNAHKK